MAPGSELRFSMGGEAYILGLKLGTIMGIIWLFMIYLCVGMLIGVWLGLRDGRAVVLAGVMG